MKTENELANTLRFKEKTAHFPKGMPLAQKKVYTFPKGSLRGKKKKRAL